MKLMGTGSPELQSINKRRASIPLKRSLGYWARFRLAYVPPSLLHYHYNADGPHTDRPHEPGMMREPRTVGCQAGQADRGGPYLETDPYLPGGVPSSMG